MERSILIIKRKRGRPLGVPNGQRATPKWEPKEWRPKYETIVSLHVTGLGQQEIADILKMSKMQVSNVLLSESGQKRIKELAKKHNESLRASREGKIQEINSAAIDNVHQVITDKRLVEAKPLTMFDKSLQALKAFGSVPSDTSETSPSVQNTQNNIAIFTSPSFANRILSGLSKVEEILSNG